MSPTSFDGSFGSNQLASPSPFAANLLHGSDPFCMGTVISSYLILTAASCLVGKDKSNISVSLVSDTQRGQDGTMDSSKIKVCSILVHHGYEPSQTINDLAILYLDEEIKPAPENLSLFVPKENSTGPPDLKTAHCSVSSCFSGAVKSETGVVYEPKSQGLPLPLNHDEIFLTPGKADSPTTIMRNETCVIPLGGSGLICARSDQSKSLLSGVLPFTGEFGGFPRIYTNISIHSEWILSAMNKMSPCPRLTSPVGEQESEFDDYGSLSADTDVRQGPNITDNDYGGLIKDGDISYGPISYQLTVRKYEYTQHTCGAVIIDDRTAVSAAHCFDNRNPRDYVVVAGDSNRLSTEGTEQAVYVDRIIVHPNYDSSYNGYTNGYDIAIMHLKSKLKFNEYVQPAWISPYPISSIAGRNAVASGWGKTSENSQPSDTLQKATLKIASPAECRRHWNFAKNGIFCAGHNDKRTCQGDSGGPLVIENVQLGGKKGNFLVGITSFGASNCDQPGTQSGFTDVNLFQNWIDDNRAEPLCRGQFRCTTIPKCINKSWRWDNEKDCPDGSDEIGTPVKKPQQKPTSPPNPTNNCASFIEILKMYGFDVPSYLPYSCF